MSDMYGGGPFEVLAVPAYRLAHAWDMGYRYGQSAYADNN